MIASVSYDQHTILKDIMTLCNISRIDVDLTFGNGGFYKEIPLPVFRFDLDPSLKGLTNVCSSNDTFLGNDSINSVIFDPPFLTYIKQARAHDSIMGKRFGGYWKYDELETHYKTKLVETHRILKKKGVMIFKCQDIIHNHKMHCTHVNIINWCQGMFRLKDLFILPAKSRMPIPQTTGTALKVQKHARIFHSYFLVLEKL